MLEVDFKLNAGKNVLETARNIKSAGEGDLVKTLFVSLAQKSLAASVTREQVGQLLRPNYVEATPFVSSRPGYLSFVLQSWVDLADMSRTQVHDDVITPIVIDIVQFVNDDSDVLFEDYVHGVYGQVVSALAIAHSVDMHALRK